VAVAIAAAVAAVVALALAGVVWLSQSLRFLDFIINKGLSVLSFLKLTLLLLPTVLSVILPVAVLCAVIYTYNRLTTDRELVVMRAVGLSPWELARPALVLAAAATLAGFAISLYLMPAGFRTFKDEQVVLRSDLTHVLLQEGVFNTLMDQLTVYVRERQSGGTLRGILVHDERDPELSITMMAESGALVQGQAGPVFLLVNGNRQEVGREDRALRMLYFDSYALDLSPLTETPSERYREPKERYLHELLSAPQNPSEEEHRAELVAEAHRRIVGPFHAFALAMIGVAAMLTGEFNRRRQWPRIACGTATGLAYIGVAYALAGMITKSPLLVPAYYAMPLVAVAAAAAVMTRERWPRLFARPAAAG